MSIVCSTVLHGRKINTYSEVFFMALFPITNPETGEKKSINVSVHDITQWYEDNKPWVRDWSEGCATPAGEGEWKSKLVNKHAGWKTVLDKVKNAPGSNAKDLY